MVTSKHVSADVSQSLNAPEQTCPIPKESQVTVMVSPVLLLVKEPPMTFQANPFSGTPVEEGMTV